MPDLVIAQLVLETGHFLGSFHECVKNLWVRHAMYPVLRLREVCGTRGPRVRRHDWLALWIVAGRAVLEVDLPSHLDRLGRVWKWICARPFSRHLEERGAGSNRQPKQKNHGRKLAALLP